MAGFKLLFFKASDISDRSFCEKCGFTTNLNKEDTETLKDILKQLLYPCPELDKLKLENPNYPIASNSNMLKWIKNLEPKFIPWKVLEWSCQQKRDRDEDLRNQLMHNLRGVEPEDVIKYLLGYSTMEDSIKTKEVAIIYNDKVKNPFLNSLNLFNLPFKAEKVSEQLKNLRNSLG